MGLSSGAGGSLNRSSVSWHVSRRAEGQVVGVRQLLHTSPPSAMLNTFPSSCSAFGPHLSLSSSTPPGLVQYIIIKFSISSNAWPRLIHIGPARPRRPTVSTCFVKLDMAKIGMDQLSAAFCRVLSNSVLFRQAFPSMRRRLLVILGQWRVTVTGGLRLGGREGGLLHLHLVASMCQLRAHSWKIASFSFDWSHAPWRLLSFPPLLFC